MAEALSERKALFSSQGSSRVFRAPFIVGIRLLVWPACATGKTPFVQHNATYCLSFSLDACFPTSIGCVCINVNSRSVKDVQCSHDSVYQIRCNLSLFFVSSTLTSFVSLISEYLVTLLPNTSFVLRAFSTKIISHSNDDDACSD